MSVRMGRSYEPSDAKDGWRRKDESVRELMWILRLLEHVTGYEQGANGAHSGEHSPKVLFIQKVGKIQNNFEDCDLLSKS